MSTSMLNMSTDSEDSQRYSDDFDEGDAQQDHAQPPSPAPASSSGGGVIHRRGFGRRQAQALQEDEDNYSDNFEDDTSKETPETYRSSEGGSGGSERRRRGSSGAPSQQLTARSQRESLQSGRGSDVASQRALSPGSGPSRPTTPAPPREATPEPAEPEVPPLPPLAKDSVQPPPLPSLPVSRTSSQRSAASQPLPPPQPSQPADAGPVRPPLAAPEPDQEAVPEGPTAPVPAPKPALSLPLKPVSELPTPTHVWRAPDDLGKDGPVAAPPDPMLPAPAVQRSHDAIPRHLKPHAWGIAAEGPRSETPSESSPAQAPTTAPKAAVTQAPIGIGLAPASRGAAFGGARGPLALGLEAQLVDRLAERFVEQREAPTFHRKERAACKEMLEQVSWTALEPKAAQDLAALLSKHWLAPVTANEALRIFRRCLHQILCDERVVDIVENQMTHHFGRVCGPGRS